MPAFYEQLQYELEIFESFDLTFLPHLHKQVEILYLLQGALSVTIGSHNKQLSPGELALVPPNTVHSYHCTTHESHIMLIFDPNLVGNTLRRGLQFSAPFLSLEQSHPDFSYCLQAMLQEPDITLKKAYLNLLFSRICQRLKPYTAEREKDPDSVQRVLRFLCENFSHPLSLSSVAQAVGLSPWHLSKLFSQKIGCGFNHYLNALRIDLAQHLLATADLSVTQIAYDCGFESVRTFNRVFQQFTGRSPSQYRRDHIPQYPKVKL